MGCTLMRGKEGLMGDSLSNITENFEQMKKKAPNGENYWMGRDLQRSLGYDKWDNFENVIRKGMQACEGSGVNPTYHFLDVKKVIEVGKGAKVERGDWYLTRYACYLIAMNGDPAKIEIATAQTYFAVQTRRQESQMRTLKRMTQTACELLSVSGFKQITILWRE